MENNYKKIDFLAIGDIVIDAFIKLQDAHVHCNIDKEGCELCMRFGDKIPYESVTVIPAAGNSANATVSAARLGLTTALMTNIGDDQNGKDCLAILEKEKIDSTFVKIEPGKLTNYHYVLWYDIDRTILVKHQNYEYEWTNTEESQAYHSPAWIYLSSLGENSLPFYTEIIDYLKRHVSVKLAFQPGTFQIKLGKEKLKDIYARTEIFFSNVEEAERILEIQEKDISKLARGIQALGPKIVALSDGENGAYLYCDNELWHIPIYKNDLPPLESTGAGDAFASAITCALALGKNSLEAFLWGPINAMSVIHQIGSQAGLLTREKLEEYLKNTPADYKLTKIN
jgi:sugar/nucleoside kinase (ribokinase family)